MNKLKIFAAVLTFTGIGTIAAAQDTLGNYQIVSPSTFKPVIAESQKISDNPVVVDSTKRIPVLNYAISPKRINTTFEVDTITAAKMEGEPLQKLYHSMVKVGFGNYSTVYGELFFNNLRSKEYNYGVRMKHLSSSATLADKGFAGYSDNEVELYGKKFLKKHTLWGDAGYSRDVVHAYGYDTSWHEVNKNVTRNRFSLFTGRTGLISHYTDSSKINHDLQLGFYNFADIYNSNEVNFRAQGRLSGYFEQQLVSMLGGVDFYNNKTASDTFNNAILFLAPSLSGSGNNWKATIGVDARIDIADDNRFYFYPLIDFSFDPFDHILIPYAGAVGGLDKNSYRSLAQANPFIMHDIALRNTNRKVEVYAGLKGSLSSSSSYNARASYMKLASLPLFVNDTTETMRNRFEVVYDTVNVLNFHGELMIQNSEKLKLIFKGDYNSFDPGRELRAWHRPELELAFTANYNLRDKIVVKGDVFVIGKQYARINRMDAKALATVYDVKELKGIADINLGIEYRYTKILSAWVSFNNIAATRYYRWNNYPMQRFNLMGGVSFAF